VGLSVRQDISGITRAIFTNFFVHVACVRGSVLFRHICDKPHRVSSGMVFFPIDNTLSAGKGGWEWTARAKYAIYNCLVGDCRASSGRSRSHDRGSYTTVNGAVWAYNAIIDRTVGRRKFMTEPPYCDADFQVLRWGRTQSSGYGKIAHQK